MWMCCAAQSMFDELAKMCSTTPEEMGHSLLHTVSMGRLPDRGELPPKKPLFA